MCIKYNTNPVIQNSQNNDNGRQDNPSQLQRTTNCK